MLDIKFIRENAESVKKAAEQKLCTVDIDEILRLDKETVSLKNQLQELQTERNTVSKSIPKASAEERPLIIEKGREIGKKIDGLKPQVVEVTEKLEELLFLVPSIPHPDVPVGRSDEENVTVKTWGTKTQFDFEPKDHVEILEINSWADFERISSVSGSRSYSLKNELVFLEMALHRMAMEKLRGKGFDIVSTPSFAREHALVGTGHFPTGRDQVYFLEQDDIYLSGTAEVQLNSLHNGEMLTEDQLPILYAGYSPCFRREAGSYGRDVRGLIRVHQFLKTEQYVICKNDPRESEKWHSTLLETSEELVQELELPYEIVECCTGDMGTGKVRMYDINCWVPSEKKYRETHSCSSLHDWQARRSNLRYRNKEGKVVHAYTLNNTAVATPRILVPLLENHQNPDGTVQVPAALRPFLGGLEQLSGQK